MVKMGELADPARDAAAADVLAAFEAAQRDRLPAVATAPRASRSYGHLRGSAGRPYRSRRQGTSAKFRPFGRRIGTRQFEIIECPAKP
jgi:hypothetical protein